MAVEVRRSFWAGFYFSSFGKPGQTLLGLMILVMSCINLHAGRNSDGRVVPGKPPNNAGPSLAAEVLEERRPIKGNAKSTTASRTRRRAADPRPPTCCCRHRANGDRREPTCHQSVSLLHPVAPALRRGRTSLPSGSDQAALLVRPGQSPIVQDRSCMPTNRSALARSKSRPYLKA